MLRCLPILLSVLGLTVSTANAQNTNPRKAPIRQAPAKKVARPVKAPAKAAAKPAVANPVVAAGLVIREISVTGNRKIEKDAIVTRLVSKKDQPYRADDVREDVLALFKAGYFNDVKVDRKIDGKFVDLTYQVLEKPSVAEIIYEGNSELKAEEVAEASGLKPYEILNMAKIREATEKIQKLYEDKGYFLAKIDPKVEDVKADESVKLTFQIREGEKVKVKKVVFIGNKKMSDALLKSRMFTQEEGYFSSLSSSGAYKQEAFERDVMALRFTYYNQGYIQAKIDRPQVSVTPDKKGIYLTIRIEEGEQYSVGEVKFGGDLMFPEAELFETIKIDDNTIFAYDVLQRDMSELQAKYGDLGYAYTNVIPRWNFNEKDRIIDLVFEIDKGNKVYFGRIDMVGNSKTRDKVIRREMKIQEGELYNETRRRQSVENIQRLGFFEEVNFKTSTPSDRLDVMNIDVVVKERNTGQVQVSAGYGTATGFTFGGSVQQTNFMGKGQNLGVSMQLTSISSVYDVSFTEPYLYDTEWSLGGRVFQSTNSGRADYNEERKGGSLSLGHPLTENTRAIVTYGYTSSRLSPIYEYDRLLDRVTLMTDYELFPLNTAEGDASTVGGAIEYDTRNDRFRPTKGMFARTSVSNTGLFGDTLRYYKGSAEVRYFKNVFWDVVWRNSLQYGRVGSLDSAKQTPFNELFLLGGPYSLRGYRYGRVGAMRDSKKRFNYLKTRNPTWSDDRVRDESKAFYGGQQQVQYQGELQFPLIREAEMYGVLFYDIGQAEDELNSSELYSDWGFGLRWFSPIGPLRFEWGFPMKRNPLYHENGVFEFSIGTPF